MPPSSPRTTSGRRKRVALSPALIVDAAITLIERDGPESLSMRRLGAELGVEGMAVYHHVANREDLLRAIGDEISQPLHDVALAGGWRVACHRFATALRTIAVARPATFGLVGLQPFDTPTSLRPVERLLAALVADGFAPADALGVYRAVAAYTRGYALAEATGFTVDAARPAGRERLDALPEADFAILRGRADALAELGADRGFELGLRALLDGLPSPR